MLLTLDEDLLEDRSAIFCYLEASMEEKVLITPESEGGLYANYSRYDGLVIVGWQAFTRTRSMSKLKTTSRRW